MKPKQRIPLVALVVFGFLAGIFFTTAGANLFGDGPKAGTSSFAAVEDVGALSAA
jgi:hypothetical protein